MCASCDFDGVQRSCQPGSTRRLFSAGGTRALAVFNDVAKPLHAVDRGHVGTKEAYAFTVFESASKEFGLPSAIGTDNGAPCASSNALFNLSRLPVWWLRLGIEIERIKPCDGLATTG